MIIKFSILQKNGFIAVLLTVKISYWTVTEFVFLCKKVLKIYNHYGKIIMLNKRHENWVHYIQNGSRL